MQLWFFSTFSVAGLENFNTYTHRGHKYASSALSDPVIFDLLTLQYRKVNPFAKFEYSEVVYFGLLTRKLTQTNTSVNVLPTNLFHNTTICRLMFGPGSVKGVVRVGRFDI